MILLLGGTTESLAIADYLTKVSKPFIISVISDYGAELAQQHAEQVVKTVFTADNLAAFCRAHRVNLIVDATHPFARVISTLAMDEACRLAIPYLRFERPDSYQPSQCLHPVASLDEACRYLADMTGTVYLSTGSKTAPEYAARLGVERLHVRVLPTSRVLERLTAAGFLANQIDAIQGPFSVDLNVELFKHAHARIVITKESGRQGGVQEKIAACNQLGIECVLIRRPQLAYPALVTNLTELQSYLEEHDER